MQQVKAVMVPSPTTDHPCKRPRVDSPADDGLVPVATSLEGLRQQLHLQPLHHFHGGFPLQTGTPPSEGQMRPPSPMPTPMPAATASGGGAASRAEEQQLSQRAPKEEQQAQPLLQPCSQPCDVKPPLPPVPLSPFAAPDAAALFFQQQQGQPQQGTCPPDRLRDSREALVAAALSSLPSTAVPPVPALRRGLPCMPSGIPPLQSDPSGVLPVLPPEVSALLGQMAAAPSPPGLPPVGPPAASPGLGPQQHLPAWALPLVQQAAAAQQAQQGAMDPQQEMEAAMDGALGVAVNMLLSLQSRLGACEVGAAGAERQLLLMRQSLAKLADVVTKLNRNWQRVVNSHHAQLRLLWELQQRSKDAGLQGEGGPGAGGFDGGISPQTAAALQALVLHQASFMQALQEERAHGARLEARNARLEERVAGLERALGQLPR